MWILVQLVAIWQNDSNALQNDNMDFLMVKLDQFLKRLLTKGKEKGHSHMLWPYDKSHMQGQRGAKTGRGLKGGLGCFSKVFSKDVLVNMP